MPPSRSSGRCRRRCRSARQTTAPGPAERERRGGRRDELDGRSQSVGFRLGQVLVRRRFRFRFGFFRLRFRFFDRVRVLLPVPVLGRVQVLPAVRVPVLPVRPAVRRFGLRFRGLVLRPGRRRRPARGECRVCADGRRWRFHRAAMRGRAARSPGSIEEARAPEDVPAAALRRRRVRPPRRGRRSRCRACHGDASSGQRTKALPPAQASVARASNGERFRLATFRAPSSIALRLLPLRDRFDWSRSSLTQERWTNVRYP